MSSESGLSYRKRYRGLIGVELKVPVKDAHVLSVVYTPGVAEPCKIIAQDPDASFDYTCRRNTVALVTDGSRALGLGDLGPLASLPIMEGKSVIFKNFAGIDAFPICVDTQDVERFVQVVERLIPTFGAVCLEDIAAPRCFSICEHLRKRLEIPVMHNDQHAGAVLALACIINTLKLTGKTKDSLRVVINGAGAAGIATAKLLLHWGIKDIILCDTHGILHPQRKEGMNWIKEEMTQCTNPRGVHGGLAEALAGADVFIGFSAGGALVPQDASRMARDSAILAFATPIPEIDLEGARKAGARIIALSSSHRSVPNELDIAMVFPGIFRGVLDARARQINETMLVAAAQTLADLVPAEDLREDHLIPKILDFQVAPAIAAAVARAAMETNVARVSVDPSAVAEETMRFLYEGSFTVPPKSDRPMSVQEESLDLHRRYRGVVGVKAKLPVKDQHMLRLLYLPPAAAEAPRRIAQDPMKAYDLTCKSNLVAVVSDGSAVLGLGNIGGFAAMPVMEGKCALFQAFGGVEAYPICLNTQKPQEIIETVQAIAPSFGGINLEDIAAPHCFTIEQALIDSLDIPVFHDDQHGTAVVTVAALINALKVTGRDMESIRVTISGAGAAAIAVAKMLLASGVPEIVLCDRQGAIYQGRPHGMNPFKEEIASITNPHRIRGDLTEVLKGMDVFIGLSGPGLVTPEMVRSMAENPIIFAMANPIPEIMPDEAIQAGAKVVATGRSDFPNQVNNCLGFPGIFRGALDVRARVINEEMKLAAAKALADAVPEAELRPDYIIPSAMNLHVPPKVAAGVAKAAMETGVARLQMDPDQIYHRTLEYLLEGGFLRNGDE